VDIDSGVLWGKRRKGGGFIGLLGSSLGGHALQYGRGNEKTKVRQERGGEERKGGLVWGQR